ncbi:MAG: LysR family transcriptional regulator [Hyphomicrobiales bacterium]|nr:MAG: LysR family transcriptional regulator [Hyphomicrobiales bacterium]
MIDIGTAELHALRAVARHRSFRGAARQIGCAPSSLSHVVANLEKRLGVRLFNRTTRSVALTDEGAGFLSRVAPALDEIADAIVSLERPDGEPKGVLRINSSTGASERVLPLVLGFLQKHPRMQVRLLDDGRLVDIVAEGFDAGLRIREAVPQDMIAVPLGGPEAFAVVGTPAYMAARGVPLTPDDLRDHECIRVLFPSGTLHRWEFERHGTEVRIDPPGRLTLGSDPLALVAALRGAGLAYVTVARAEAHLASGDLVRAMADWTPPFDGLCLYFPRQRAASPGLAAFVAHLKARREA